MSGRQRQLGRALTILAQHDMDEEHMHADVDAFHAPGECHALVARDQEKRYRAARRHARAVSGLNRRLFNRAVKQLPRRHWERLQEQCWLVAFGHYLPERRQR